MSKEETIIPSPVLLPTTSFSFQATDAAAAIIVVDGDRFLLQHRDTTGGILYPGSWGCFGGALDAGEEPMAALRRELKEETGYDVAEASYFTSVNYDFSFCGKGKTQRMYYIVPVTGVDVSRMSLGEGQGMSVMSPEEIFALGNIIPFDLFAIWLYANRAALSR